MPIVWSGYEVGLAVRYPHESIETDFNYADDHPLKESYVRYKPPHDRPCWDLTSVLQAVRPGRGYFDLSAPGRVTVTDDGETVFSPAADGRDRYLIVPEDGIDRIVEALTLLASQPRAPMNRN